MILIDTTPLVALCDHRDALHRRAVADFDRLGRRMMVLCEPVLTEAWFLLDTVPLRARLDALIAGLAPSAWAPPRPEAFRRDVLDWLARYAEHEPDWADGCLVVASATNRRARVWTYDTEFRTTWRRPDGSRVPLAVG